MTPEEFDEEVRRNLEHPHHPDQAEHLDTTPQEWVLLAAVILGFILLTLSSLSE